MKKVKITVIETTLNEKLASEYGAPGITKCPFHKVGDEFIYDAMGKPEGLCDDAWSSMLKYAFALSSGADGFWPEWIEQRYISINSCSDGMRPVIFKLEPME